MPRPTNFDLKRELAEQSSDDWQFGALSQPSVVSIPQSERERYLPVGETQFDEFADFTDCASRSPVNHLEALFTYHYDHDMKPENKLWLGMQGYLQDGKVTFSDRYIAILSGTTHQGNSLKSPLEAIRKQGLIPKKLLPKEDWMKWEDYYISVPQNLKDLGQEFLKRFTLNYEQVSQVRFSDVLKDDMIGVAGYAWPAPDSSDVYHSDSASFNHAFLIYNLPKYQVFDNYMEAPGDFTKNLAPDYKLFDYGYRVYLSKETIPQEKFDFLKWLNTFLESLKPKPLPTLSKREQIYQAALSQLGKDASPEDKVSDDVACVDSVSHILRQVMPFPDLYGTAELLRYLKASHQWEGTLEPDRGNIILSVTGTGDNTIRGHVGVHCGDGWIMSNTSADGIWRKNYTIEAWVKRFRLQHKMPLYYFTPL